MMLVAYVILKQNKKKTEEKVMFGIDHLVQEMQLVNCKAYFSGVIFLIIVYSR